MNFYLEPNIKKDLNQNFSAKFELMNITLPNYMFAPGVWVDGTAGLVYELIDAPFLPGEIVVTDYINGTSGTQSLSHRSNKANEIYQGEALIFGNRVPFKDICAWKQIIEDISGDTDFLYFQKDMRWSVDRVTWTPWMTVSKESLPQSEYCDDDDYWFEFKYIALPYNNLNRTRTYTSLDPLLTDNYDILTKDLQPIIIDIDYPNQGTVEVYLNNFKVDKPLAFKFGTISTKADSIPNKGDFIFISQYHLGYEITSSDTIEIRYKDRLLPEGYKKHLNLNNLSLIGNYVIEKTQTIVTLTEPGQCAILEPSDIYKAFKFTGFQIDVTGILSGTSGISERTLEMKYRISHNYKKSWTPWEYLTTDNIKTLKPDPIRFLNLQIAFCRGGTNTSGVIKVYDLLLEGDFQNVTKSYATINRFGFRGDCDYTKNPNADECSDINDIPEIWKNPRSKNCDTNTVDDECSDSASYKSTWNVYDLQPLNLYNKLSNDNTNLFGHEVSYYKTKADAKGIDPVLHEEQLLYISDKCKIKVLVPENKFPENTIHFQMFDLALFESFKINITRDEFKLAFGKEERPAKGDILNFCILNRWYIIEHAQAHKDVLNGSVYYDVVLKKYQHMSHIDKREFKPEIENILVHNSLDDLFGEDVQREMNKVGEVSQMETLTKEPTIPIIEPGKAVISGKGSESIRKDFDSSIVEDYDLYNSSVVVSRYHYNLGLARFNEPAIVYGFSDKLMTSDNRTFVLWFNIQNYITGHRYVLLDNRHPTMPLGYDIAFQDGMIDFRLNDQNWLWDVSVNLNTWYIVVIQLNQRERIIDLWLYKRQNEDNPLIYSTTDFVKVTHETSDIEEPQEFSIDRLSMKLIGSPILLTNLRVWDSLLPESEHNDVLNQYFIKDNRDLIISDNAQKQLYAVNRGA